MHDVSKETNVQCPLIFEEQSSVCIPASKDSHMYIAPKLILKNSRRNASSKHYLNFKFGITTCGWKLGTCQKHNQRKQQMKYLLQMLNLLEEEQ
jgi:hypothetical protein